MNIDQIAKVAHDSFRSLCQSVGDHSIEAWEEVVDWRKKATYTQIKCHLADLVAGAPLDPSRSHKTWMQEKLDDGWKWGPVKDPSKKEHPDLVDYSELSTHARMKDQLFGAVVKAFYDCK